MKAHIICPRCEHRWEDEWQNRPARCPSCQLPWDWSMVKWHPKKKGRV